MMKHNSLFKAILVLSILTFIIGFSAGSVLAQKLKLSVAGAGVGKSSYIQAAALADYVSSKSGKLALTAQTTRGFVHNARLVNSGETELGFSSTTIIYPALQGVEKFKKDGKLTNLRGVTYAGVSVHYWVTLRGRGIKSIKDFEGKRINLGTPGSNTKYIAEVTLKSYGILDKVNKSSLNTPGSAQALMDGKIDAWCIAGHPPSSSVIEIFSSKKGAMILGIDEYMFDPLLKKYKPFGRSVLPATTYAGLTKDVPVIGYISFLLAHKDVPDSAVYEVLQTISTPQAKKRLMSVSPKWEALKAPDLPKLKGMSQIGLKLHPGAEKYWRGKGLKIPANIAN
jgi:TRAP transporter TAXI family solute receptor